MTTLAATATATATQPYRGADRRMNPRPSAPRSAVRGWPLAVLVVLLVAAAGVVAPTDAVRAEALEELRQVLRAALLAGAGLLLLGRWRTAGLARPAVLGVALLVVAFSHTITSLSPLILGMHTPPLSEPALRLLPAVAAAVLVLAARRVHPVDASARPVYLLVVTLLTVAFAAAGVLLLTAGTAATDDAALVAACAGWRGALWVTVAVLERRASTNVQDDSRWLLVVLALMGVAAFLDAAQALWGQPFGAAAAVLSIAAAAVALRGAAAEFGGSLAAQNDRLLRLTADASDQRQRRRSAEESEAVRLHEVRNVLAGLHGATAALRRYEDRLDPGVRQRLERAVSAELQRLQHLVDPPQSTTREPVVVKDALEPVLLSERQLGARIRADVHQLVAYGCAADIATICSALLVNARVHAPGSPVMLRARRVDGAVQLVVEDAGPGIPQEMREAVFARGERAFATAPGTGLGLFNARCLAEQMGGTLEVGHRAHGGAAFVLTLPQAQVPAPRSGTNR